MAKARYESTRKVARDKDRRTDKEETEGGKEERKTESKKEDK